MCCSPDAVALALARIASASPEINLQKSPSRMVGVPKALLMRSCFAPSEFKITLRFSASATLINESLDPSESKICALFFLSASA